MDDQKAFTDDDVRAEVDLMHPVHDHRIASMLQAFRDTMSERDKLKKELSDLDLTLTGVMHFSDKWLPDYLADGGPKGEPENRAAESRKIALEIIERVAAERDKLRAFAQDVWSTPDVLDASLKHGLIKRVDEGYGYDPLPLLTGEEPENAE